MKRGNRKKEFLLFPLSILQIYTGQLASAGEKDIMIMQGDRDEGTVLVNAHSGVPDNNQ